LYLLLDEPAVGFTDDPLITYAENPSTATTVQALYITQLRTAVNAVRSLAGLSAASWTNSTLTATVSIINADDVRDLRTALDAAHNTLGIPLSAYTDNQLAAAPTCPIFTLPVDGTFLASALHFINCFDFRLRDIF